MNNNQWLLNPACSSQLAALTVSSNLNDIRLNLVLAGLRLGTPRRTAQLLIETIDMLRH